jgi:hypothetical protein
VNVAPGKSYFVPTKAALLAHFASVFNAQVLGKLSRLEPHDVFCRNEQTMLADGTLWASVGFDGVLRATVVNVMPF